MTKPKKKWSKPKLPKRKYRKPSEARLVAKRTNLELETRVALLELRLQITREQQAAIFYVLDARQQQKVLAYHEEE